MRAKTFPIVVVLMLSLSTLLSACNGGGGTNTTTTGSPADAAKAFWDAVLAGDKAKATDNICATLKPTVDQITQAQAAAISAGTKYDLSGVKFDVSSQSGDTATIKASGNMKVTVGGTSQDSPFPSTTMTMKNESGWKYCGA